MAKKIKRKPRGYVAHGFKFPKGYAMKAFAGRRMAKRWASSQRWLEEPKISPLFSPNYQGEVKKRRRTH